MKETKGIYRRGQIYWFATQKNGVRHQVSLQTEDLPEAIRRAREIKASPELAPRLGVAAETRLFLQEKVNLKKFSKTTARVHGSALQEFCLRCGTMNLSEVKLNHIEDHYRSLQKRVAEATAQIHLRAIKAFFSWCVKEKKIHESPCAGLQLARINQPARLRFCTSKQRDELIKDAPDDDLKFILYAGFHCGLRKNEIIEARAGWFDLHDGGACHVENTPTFRIKDGERRFIPLTAEFRQFLARYLKDHKPDDFALKPKVAHGHGTYRYDFHRPYNQYLTSKGMRWVTAHVMRHTFASLLVQAGVSVFKVARWMGDGVAVVEKHYAHLAPQDRDIEKMI